jgi:hypothetical protein
MRVEVPRLRLVVAARGARGPGSLAPCGRGLSSPTRVETAPAAGRRRPRVTARGAHARGAGRSAARRGESRVGSWG